MLQAVKIKQPKSIQTGDGQLKCKSCEAPYGLTLENSISLDSRLEWRCSECISINSAEFNRETGKIKVKLV